MAFWLAVAQQLLGLLFVVAGVAKIRAPHKLKASMIALGIRSPSLVRVGSVTVPWLELVSGTALVVGVASQAAAAVLGVMLVGFTVLLSVKLASGQEFQCHCFGSAGEGPTTWGSVLRNLGLLGLAVGALLPVGQPDLSFASVLVAGGLILATFLLKAVGGLLRAASGETS